MKKTKSLHHGHRFPAAVISCALRWYFRFSLSLRDIEESLLERGVVVTYETIRRGLLTEHGIAVAQTPLKLRTQLPAIVDDQRNELTGLSRAMMTDLYERLKFLAVQIERYDELIRRTHNSSALCQRPGKVRGVGPMIATAVVAAAGNATELNNGRQFAAWLGRMPRQHSSGGRQRLFGITKRGNGYLRMLLVHGARAVVQQTGKHTDELSRWILDLQSRRGTNITVVALANKIARAIWVLLARGQEYKPCV
ncbi:IS110 family transposase [Paraburkholderia aromaticivorans]|uniref:IS110 family transposase n=1 Tax=Paraburkholderia aromaticivorans TaxID=2026199 RepID=UPI001F10BF5B|nr:IS110 family transposase [Paraburkholderia aromaticivorans]